MTTEDDFQAALDASPDDWQTRLVFADWLQERGDPRAEGTRALGVMRRCPRHENEGTSHASDCRPYWASEGNHAAGFECSELPHDWFEVLDVRGKSEYFAPRWTDRTDATRHELETAAALAFTKLPPERRAELLATGASTPPEPLPDRPRA